MYIKIFKNFRIYAAIFISLFTIELFTYKDTVLASKNVTPIVTRVPKKGDDDPDSGSRVNVLTIKQITCNATAESAPYNMVKIAVYKNNSDGSSELLTSWGPAQLGSGQNAAVNNSAVFQGEVVVILTYLDNNGAEQMIGYRSLSGLVDGSNLSFVGEGNSANYSLSYSIQATNNSSQ